MKRTVPLNNREINKKVNKKKKESSNNRRKKIPYLDLQDGHIGTCVCYVTRVASVFGISGLLPN